MNRSVRRILVALCAAVLLPAWASAQDRQVTGQVTSAETSQPIAGVQVVVQGTEVATLTNDAGRYNITVPSGATTLVFSFLGYETLEATITGSALDVRLSTSPISLEGIVVTALGLEQQARAISTSVAEIEADEFTDVPEPNIVNALAGEVAGVQTTATGPAGGSARIVIRGATSISGNNQPLFVVDGIPIDNSAPMLGGYSGFDYGNAAADLNAADIASVTVLKGPNAAALYGSRAANGAILVTTKGGDATALGGPQIVFQSNVSWSTPLRLPEYQNQYGQGYGGEYSYVDGRGGGVNDNADESWGPPCDGRMIPQFFSGGEPAPFECHPDNVRNFFDVGLTTYNNLALATATDRASLRLSVGNEHMDGMYPGFKQDKWNLSLNGRLQITDRLSADGSVNYMRKHAENRPGIGYTSDNFMQQFVWFGRTISMEKLREVYEAGVGEDQHNTWNSAFHTNPFWIALKNDNWDDRNRIIGNTLLSYDLRSGVTANFRAGTDWYQDDRNDTHWADETPNAPYNRYSNDLINRSETNVDLFFNVNRSLTPDITLNATVGGNHRYQEDNFHNASVAELTVPGIFTAENSVRPVVADNSVFQTAMNSLYGQAQFGYRNYLFLQVTGRNDWSSTLPEANNSYFYPSVSGSFIFTDVFDLGSDILSLGKVRASWARVGNDADPYQLAAYYSAETSFDGNIPAYAVPNQIANSALKPEQTESWEVGADLRFFEGRFGLGATYYDQSTFNQILATDISAASGFYQQVVNAGEIANSGVELQLTANPISLDNGFRWDVTANYANNRSEVVELFEDLETYQLGSYWQATTEARVGDAYGSMYGLGFKRDPVSGKMIVNDDGLPIPTDERILLGNYTPDWLGSLSNTFSYKGLQLGFLLDARQGGELFSVTQMFGQYTGVLKGTLVGREESFGTDEDGNYVCEPGITLDAVTESGEQNTTEICPNRYYKWLFNSGIREAHVYDASYVKLREARLAYTLPQSWVTKTPFSSLTVSLVGRNLALWTDMPNIDPETAFDAGNSQGFEFGQIPSGRSFGFNFIVTP